MNQINWANKQVPTFSGIIKANNVVIPNPNVKDPITVQALNQLLKAECGTKNYQIPLRTIISGETLSMSKVIGINYKGEWVIVEEDLWDLKYSLSNRDSYVMAGNAPQLPEYISVLTDCEFTIKYITPEVQILLGDAEEISTELQPHYKKANDWVENFEEELYRRERSKCVKVNQIPERWSNLLN